MEVTCLSTDEISGREASGHPVLHDACLWQSSTDNCFLLSRSLFQARDISSFPQHKQWGCPPTVTTLLRYITRAHNVLCSKPDMGPKMKSNDIIETVLCRLGWWLSCRHSAWHFVTFFLWALSHSVMHMALVLGLFISFAQFQILWFTFVSFF